MGGVDALEVAERAQQADADVDAAVADREDARVAPHLEAEVRPAVELEPHVEPAAHLVACTGPHPVAAGDRRFEADRVVVTTGEFAYRRRDGVAVVPRLDAAKARLAPASSVSVPASSRTGEMNRWFQNSSPSLRKLRRMTLQSTWRRRQSRAAANGIHV